MGVLDDLIKIKKVKKTDDLLKMIDEVSVYEKLAIDENLKDLSTSAITRAKCPLLAAFIDGNYYETILAELVSNIYLQIEGRIPDILFRVVNRTAKQQKQIEIIQAGVSHVEYRDIMEYDHETMKDRVSAVFTKSFQNATIAVIVIREIENYVMYHGVYTETETKHIAINKMPRVVITGQFGIFTMKSYSILGNNGYRFGSYRNEHIFYDVMIEQGTILYLMNGNITAFVYEITAQEHNNLNLAKNDPHKFAEILTDIIERVVHS